MSADDVARLAREVQDLGFDTTRVVVEQFGDLFRRYAEMAASATVGDGAGEPSTRGVRLVAAPLAANGRLGADLRKAIDAYLAVLRQFSDVSLSMFSAGPSAADPAPSERLELPPAAPGGRCSARLWLHNSSSSAVVDARPWTTALVDHGGGTLPAAVVTFAPVRIARLDPGESAELLVLVEVPSEAVIGRYHGQVLVERLADVVLPLVLDVVAEAAGAPPSDGAAPSAGVDTPPEPREPA
jgi:hypothetical protein